MVLDGENVGVKVKKILEYFFVLRICLVCGVKMVLVLLVFVFVEEVDEEEKMLFCERCKEDELGIMVVL